MRFKKFDNVKICMEPLLCVLGLCWSSSEQINVPF